MPNHNFVLFDRVRVVRGDIGVVTGVDVRAMAPFPLMGEIGVVTGIDEEGVRVQWETRRFDDAREARRWCYLYFREIERVQP